MRYQFFASTNPIGFTPLRAVSAGFLAAVGDSNYDASRVFLSLNATSCHARAKMEALPRLSLFLSHDDFDGHAYTGPSVSFEVTGGSDTVALLGLATELRHELEPLANGTILIPAGRFGIEAWLSRSQDGAVYSGTLEIEETEAATFVLGAGLTAFLPNTGRFDLSLDYLGDGSDLGGIEGTLAYALRF